MNRKRVFSKDDDFKLILNDNFTTSTSIIVTDDKVIAAINKFQLHGTIGEGVDKSEDGESSEASVSSAGLKFVKLIASSSEIELISDNLSSLKVLFNTNFSVFDNILSIYGLIPDISRSVAYLAFILSKINNFAARKLTLKSVYSVSLIVDTGCLTNGDHSKINDSKNVNNTLTSLESFPFYFNNLSQLFLESDLQSIFSKTASILSSGGSNYPDDDSAIHKFDFRVHINATILATENNSLILSESKRKVDEYLKVE